MYPLFRAAWQMPTKPCITSPAPSLKFRTAGFPQYGFKAGISDAAFLRQPSRAVCFRPSCSPRRHSTSVQSRSYPLGEAPPCKQHPSLYPRGPRSGPGYAVPILHRLIDPIRPTRGHIEISPHCGLYPMPSLGAKAPRPASGSVLSLLVPSRHAALYDPGDPVADTHPVTHQQHWPSPL